MEFNGLDFDTKFSQSMTDHFPDFVMLNPNLVKLIYDVRISIMRIDI